MASNRRFPSEVRPTNRRGRRTAPVPVAGWDKLDAILSQSAWSRDFGDLARSLSHFHPSFPDGL